MHNVQHAQIVGQAFEPRDSRSKNIIRNVLKYEYWSQVLNGSLQGGKGAGNRPFIPDGAFASNGSSMISFLKEDMTSEYRSKMPNDKQQKKTFFAQFYKEKSAKELVRYVAYKERATRERGGTVSSSNVNQRRDEDDEMEDGNYWKQKCMELKANCDGLQRIIAGDRNKMTQMKSNKETILQLNIAANGGAIVWFKPN